MKYDCYFTISCSPDERYYKCKVNMLSIYWYDKDNHCYKENKEREDPEIDVNISDFDYCIAIPACHGHVF